MQDFHAHSNYSDGEFLSLMVDAAERAGLDGIGITDHCSVAERELMHAVRTKFGFNLDITYERRREGIRQVRDETDLAVYDAVEMDYDPRDEAVIREFLDEADFDYAVGSVHGVDGDSVQFAGPFEDMADDQRQAVVDRYFEQLVALVESELFDVAAHLDLITRAKPLRGYATDEHYRAVARAFADSRTVPEINAGRALRDGGIVHPREPFRSTLRDHDVAFTLGSDSHSPDEVTERAPFLAEFVDEHGIDVVKPPGLEG